MRRVGHAGPACLDGLNSPSSTADYGPPRAITDRSAWANRQRSLCAHLKRPELAHVTLLSTLRGGILPTRRYRTPDLDPWEPFDVGKRTTWSGGLFDVSLRDVAG